ncbi:uncharacterized protein PAC_15393 [Phialocephala subalpina]|uniref:Uncharacterized protein n=1 Tax=Phialocephala subalpina TaxID=576137 RepID=A0A1L7XKF8_9HELO|nr:uncharacterized protein PAC_15393 [Phialocephala subalpina]
MRVEEEKKELSRKTNTTMAANRKNVNHTCITFPRVPGSTSFGTTSQANASTSTPPISPFGRQSSNPNFQPQVSSSTTHTSPFGVPSGAFNTVPQTNASVPMPHTSSFSVPSGTFTSPLQTGTTLHISPFGIPFNTFASTPQAGAAPGPSLFGQTSQGNIYYGGGYFGAFGAPPQSQPYRAQTYTIPLNLRPTP